MWALQGDDVIRFRTSEAPLLDVSGRVLDGRLGTLHVGMSRVEALDASRRAVWVVGAALLGGLAVVLLAASFVAARVGRPLQELESAVLHLPAKLADREVGQFQVTGTREVESLARGFIDLADRLGALEKERAATQQQMIQAERMAALGEMAAGLAHEIHNPLDGMLECVRYLDADPAKSERMEKYLPMFRDGLGRIAQVMRHMLTLARSGQRLPTETKAVAEVVDELVLMTEKQLEARGVRLIVQQPGSCLCFCNANALLQAMLNLVLNACDAVDGREEREIRLAARCDSERVYLSVGDNGPGVPAELRERIFAPFFTRRPMGKGTGLGLSISRELVQSVGGELTLAETPSDLGGARFVVQLPRMPELENCCASDKGEHPHRG